MHIHETTDVLVVGAGPTGLTVSAMLAALGIAHVTVDRAPLGANTSRAAVVHSRTLEALEELEVTDRLLARGVRVPVFTVRDGRRTLARIDFSGLPTRHRYTLMIPQSDTERVLADRLAELGGHVATGRLADLDLDSRPGRALATLVDGNGPARVVDARYVVGADGMHSAVRERAGIRFEGAPYAQSFVLADVRMDWPLPPAEVQLFFAPAGLVVVAPLPGGRHRVVATVDDAPEHPDRDDVARLLAERGPAAAVHEVVWSSRFRVHHRLAETYRRGPVLLAGDAAHVHSPAGGQGMNTGIQDAVLLGRTLAGVLTGSAADPALDGYAAVRRPVARDVVRLTDRMTRAATLRGPAARLRNLALAAVTSIPAARRRVAMELSELSTPDVRPSGQAGPTAEAALRAATSTGSHTGANGGA